MQPALLIDKHNHIATLTLNEPNTRNAISDAMIESIVSAVENINIDETIRCVILTANGRAFSAGGNIKAMLEPDSMFSGSPDEVAKKYQAGIQRLPQALLQLKAPLIAAIQGPAVGAGMDMCLCADIRICSDQAFFAHSFCQLGLISGDGGHWLLTRAIGYSKAVELSLTGERINAEQAKQLGIVRDITKADNLAATAQQLAEKIAANPRDALISAKALSRKASMQTFAEAQLSAAMLQGILHNSDEHKQRVNALVKRIKKTT